MKTSSFSVICHYGHERFNNEATTRICCAELARDARGLDDAAFMTGAQRSGERTAANFRAAKAMVF